MQPPRALWVPYQLGRPFGTPNDKSLQARVLRAVLALLDSPAPGPLLEDYPEPAPHSEGEPGWTFPGAIDSRSLQAEVLSIEASWQWVRDRSGGSTIGISALSPERAVEYIKTFHADEPMTNPQGMSRIGRARFAIDDIKAYYLEAASAGEGHPSSFQLHEWFWEQTLAGAMIRDFQDAARSSEDKNLRQIADSLVPAERVNSLRR